MVDSLLGGGSYGVVVRTRKAGRFYAMKVSSDQYLKRRKHRSFCADLLGREAEMLQSIQHPAIPGWVGFFGREDMYCLVQEYVPGNTLAELINQGYRFQEDEVRTILLKLLEILRFLHTSAVERPAVVHRDLRLSNLIMADNTLFLVDFGLAHRVGNGADKAFLNKLFEAKKGTAASPSYAKMRKDFSVQSDLFGAGVVAVDLFTNSADSDASKPWERRIQVSPLFKAFVRRLLGVEGKFASSSDAYDCLLNHL